MNVETSLNIHTLSGVRWIVAEKLLGEPSLAPVMTWRGGMREGRAATEGGHVCIIMADLCCCMAGTNTIL